MARIRSIHPDALKSRKLASVSADAERCFWRLLTHCDDDGRSEDEPDLFAAYLFPLHPEIDGAQVDRMLTDLADSGLIERYEVDGLAVLQVLKWGTYQHPKRKQPSTLPPAHSPHVGEQRGNTSPHAHPTVPYGVEGRGDGGELEGRGSGGGEFDLNAEGSVVALRAIHLAETMAKEGEAS